MEKENENLTVEEVQQMIDDAMLSHMHNGVLTQLNDVKDIWGLIEVVSAAPTKVPTNLWEQVKIYSNGATYRLYWYDFTRGAWTYTAGT